MKIEPNNQAALEFMQLWNPNGWWVLTAITTDKTSIITETFDASKLPELIRFLETFNGERNIYFHVNSVKEPIFKKAQREDIKSVDWLHVDIDPRPGEELEHEHERARRLVENPPANVPPPTVIIFSGGGYQAFWKLTDPILIDGDLEKAEDAKRYNIQLETIFGADNCHNIDRIMRLPGTINLPDKVKLRKGRKKSLASLIKFDTSITYPLSVFTPSPLIQSQLDIGFTKPQEYHVQFDTEIVRLQSIEDLPEKVPTWVKVLIVQGTNPDEPTKYPSRSEALFAVCCELVRCQVSDEQIFSILTDPDFRISESVLEKKGQAERYARRQIQRAHEFAIDPKLEELNQKHAVISDMGGKCRIISEVWDYSVNRTKISKQSFDDFRNRYMNQKIEIGQDQKGNPMYMPLGKWWLENKHRTQYDTLLFAPGKEIMNAYNLWKGFACAAIPGDCSLFFEHIKDSLCGGNEDYYRYLRKWMARCVQHPDSPGETAVVLRGKQGTGKSFFAKQFGSLFGRHFIPVSDPKHLVGSFNAHLRDCVVLFGDEAFFAGDKKHESTLKMLVTEELITIEAKGIDAEVAPNYIHLIMASNSNWVVPAGGNERRFFVLDVDIIHKRDTKFFNAVRKQLDNGGREALLHELLTEDLTGFTVQQVPQTEALLEQKLLSLSPEQEWWYKKLDEGRLLPHHTKWECEIGKEILLEDYLKYTQKLGILRKSSSTVLGKFFRTFCPPNYPISFQRRNESKGGSRPYYYRFPSLEICRNIWNEHYENAFTWQPEHIEDDITQTSDGIFS